MRRKSPSTLNGLVEGGRATTNEDEATKTERTEVKCMMKELNQLIDLNSLCLSKIVRCPSIYSDEPAAATDSRIFSHVNLVEENQLHLAVGDGQVLRN